MADTALVVPIQQLRAGDNPRLGYTEEGLAELEASVKVHGILDPIRVREVAEGDYVIESGHRRWTAALAAGLTEVPVLSINGPTKTEDDFVRAIVTNVQREDMNPVDEAMAYSRLKGRGLTVDGIAEQIGVAKARVTTRLAILELPVEIVELFKAEKLPLGCRTSLADLAKVDDGLAVAVATECAGRKEWAEVLAKEPLRVVVYVAQLDKHAKRFFVIPNRIDANTIPKVPKALKERMEKLSSQWNVYTPTFSVDDANEAISSGLAYTVKGADHAVVADAAWMAAKLADVVAREEKRREDFAATEARRKARDEGAAAAAGAGQDTDAEAAAKEFRAKERQALANGKELAHGLNQQLFAELFTKLEAPVKGISIEDARLLVHLGVKGGAGRLFRMGLSLCKPEMCTEEKQKSGKIKRSYVQGYEDVYVHAQAFLDVKDGEELVRRLVIMLGCARYSDEGVIPQSSWQKSNSIYAFDAAESNGSQIGPRYEVTRYVDRLVKPLVPAKLRAKVRPSQLEVDKLRKEYEITEA